MDECKVEQLREIFGRFDMDKDGSIAILELAALLRALRLQLSGDQIYTLLINMDSNGNGSVEFDELLNALLCDLNDELFVNQEHLIELFHLFDRDSNGYITTVELGSCMDKMGATLDLQRAHGDD